MSTALELRRAHWAPRNAVAKAAGFPDPDPEQTLRRDHLRKIKQAIAAGSVAPLWVEIPFFDVWFFNREDSE